MKKSFKIDKMSIGLRFDRWIRNNIGKIPQSLIEKDLRKGNIKLNQKKVKSSTKLKLNDEITFFNFNYKFNLTKNSKKYNPTNEIIKESENQIIDDNENFVVINKKSGISVQGGTKSKKNLIDIFSKSKIFLNKKIQNHIHFTQCHGVPGIRYVCQRCPGPTHGACNNLRSVKIEDKSRSEKDENFFRFINQD